MMHFRVVLVALFYALFCGTNLGAQTEIRFSDLSEIFTADQIAKLSLSDHEAASVYVARQPFSSEAVYPSAEVRLSQLLQEFCGFSQSAQLLFNELSQGDRYILYTLHDFDAPCLIASYHQTLVSQDFANLNSMFPKVARKQTYSLDEFRGLQQDIDTEIRVHLRINADNKLTDLTVVLRERVRWFWQSWVLEFEQKRDTDWMQKTIAHYDFALELGLIYQDDN